MSGWFQRRPEKWREVDYADVWEEASSKGSAAGHKRHLLGSGRDQGDKEGTSQEGGRRWGLRGNPHQTLRLRSKWLLFLNVMERSGRFYAGQWSGHIFNLTGLLKMFWDESKRRRPPGGHSNSLNERWWWALKWRWWVRTQSGHSADVKPAGFQF